MAGTSGIVSTRARPPPQIEDDDSDLSSGQLEPQQPSPPQHQSQDEVAGGNTSFSMVQVCYKIFFHFFMIKKAIELTSAVFLTENTVISY